MEQDQDLVPEEEQHERVWGMRYSTHFCRECGEKFEYVQESSGPRTPHAQEYLHRYEQHRDAAQDYQSCSRYCVQRAQHEEIQAGHRLYGKGITQPKPVTTYDRIFPEEN